mgnify:CR=1 FL=1
MLFRSFQFLIWFAIVFFGLGIIGFTWYKWSAPAIEQVRYDTFKNSQAYNDGMLRDLYELKRDYDAEMKNIPFPEHIFKGVNPKEVEFLKRNWSGNLSEFIDNCSKEIGIEVVNVFHAGDGNLHPLLLFDASKPGDFERTEQFANEILAKCVEVGGTITGEHGVGVEKIDAMCAQFNSDELESFHGIKRAFDPDGLLNPGKAVPSLHRCAEFGRLHVHHGQVPHPDLPRF